jgi:hypothetical protein
MPGGGGTAACRIEAAATVQCQGSPPLVKPSLAAPGREVKSHYCIASDIFSKPCPIRPEQGLYGLIDSSAATRVVNWEEREYLELTVSW